MTDRTEKYCNKCGKHFDMWDALEGTLISKQLGFGTKYDGEFLEMNICCSCLEKLIDTCMISPLSHNT